MFDGESFPSIIKFVRVSLLGRPRLDDDDERGDIFELEGDGLLNESPLLLSNKFGERTAEESPLESLGLQGLWNEVLARVGV